jgi:predicted amidophosphoribosyltransferase
MIRPPLASTIPPVGVSAPGVQASPALAAEEATIASVDHYAAASEPSVAGAPPAPPSAAAYFAAPAPDDGGSAASWRPKQGDTVFHVRYGEVEVLSVKTISDLDIPMVEYCADKHRVSERFDPEIFAPNDRASPAYQHHLGIHLDRTRYLPELVGIAYIMKFEEKLKAYTSLFPAYPHLKTAVKMTASRHTCYNNCMPNASSLIGQHVGIERIHAVNIPTLTSAHDLFRMIWEEAGIDVVEEGFRYIGDCPSALEKMIEARIKKGGASYHHVFNISRTAIEHYAALKGNLTKMLGIEKGPLPPTVWAVGDYDADHKLYLALRSGDPQAIAHFADRMVRRIAAVPELQSATSIAAVPGREAFGMPVDLLAKAVAAQMGKPFLDGIWMPRPADRVESEAGISFRQKRAQADEIYQIDFRGLSREARKGLRSQTIILIDDNFTTGATTEAAALALMGARAKKVLRLVATATRRGG